MKKVSRLAIAFIALICGVSIYFWKNQFLPTHNSNKKKFTHDKLHGKDSLVDVAIIGSGAAGLSAAVYTTRAQLYTVVFQGKQPGGQLTTTSYVENWPGLPKMLGKDIMKGLQDQATGFGAHISNETIEKIDLTDWPYALHTSDGTQVHALSLIIATGAEPKTLGVKGEREYWGKGVTTCAICDAPFYKDRKVVVIGGGDSASEEAIQLAAYASEVTLLVRGDHMRASQAMQAKLQEYAHIHIIYNVKVQEIMGNGEYVTGIDIIREGKQEVMATDGVFLAIGHKPNSELVKNSINCDAQGYIVVEGLTQKTSQPGVFAAGDVADHRYRQAGVAAGDGIKAALDAERFLREDISVSSLRYDNGSHYFVPENRNGGNSLELIETIQDLEKKIGKNMITIVDVYAPYCPDCMAFLPTVEKVAERYIGKVAFVKVDLSKLPELSKKYEVYSIPCLLLFKEGNLISKINEVLPLRDLIDITDKLIA